MSKQPAPASLLYSDGQPEHIRNVMIRLRDGGHDRFRTRTASVGGTTLWLDARRDDPTGLWIVTRSQRAPDGSRHQDFVFEGKPVCFFDALHCCGSFEMQRNLLVDQLPEDSSPHYSVAAKAAAIPLDDDGLPHPAVKGRILTAGSFSPEADAIAESTKDRELPDILPAIIRANNQGDILDRSLMQKKERVQQEKNALQQTLLTQTLNDASKAIDFCATLISHKALYGRFNKCGFLQTSGFFADGLDDHGPIVMISVLFPPLLIITIPGLLMAAINHASEERHKADDFIQINRAVGIIKKTAGRFSGYPAEKTLLNDFANAAKATYLLCAASHYRDVILAGERGQSELGKAMKRGLKMIDKASDLMNLPDEKRNALRTSFRNGSFPRAHDFAHKLQESAKLLLGQIQTRHTTLLPPASAA